MAKEYRRVDREQPFLLPPSMREWLPQDHVVWFVIAAVARMDTTAFHAKAKLGSVGRRGYDPDMMVTLFTYAMAHGVTSSRQIERQCATDVAFRIICASDVPDHTVLARFRQRHEQALEDLLTESLVLAAELGMVRFGQVALDGTKIKASAAKDRNYTEEHLRKLAREHLQQAAAMDEAEDALFGEDNRGDELPEKLRDRSGRGERITKALDVLKQRRADEAAEAEAERAKGEQYAAKMAGTHGSAPTGRPPKGADPVAVARARYERERARAAARYEQYQAKRAAAAARGYKLRGTPTLPPDEHSTVIRLREAYEQAQTEAAQACGAHHADATTKDTTKDTTKTKDTVNLTDPDSRLLKTRNGFIQGYNAQTATSADQFILHAEATQDANDVHQFIPTADSVQATAEHLAERVPERAHDLHIGTLTADSGYDSEDNLTADGPDRLIANAKQRDLTRRAATDPATGDPPAEASTREQMDHRLRTEEGQALYRRRAPLVEAPNSWLKDRRGLRAGFSRRGRKAVQSEFSFACAVTNILHLRNLGITTTNLIKPATA